MNNSFIYIIKDPSGIIRYVGQTTWGQTRFRDHVYAAKRGKTQPVSCFIRKYLSLDQQVIFEIVEHCEVDQLSSREMYWINHYTSSGLSLLNQTEGGEGGKRSDEARQRMSKAKLGVGLTPEARAKVSKSLEGNKRRLGVPHSEEAKVKISEALVGNAYRAESIVGINLKSNQEIEFSSVGEAAELLKCSLANISHCLRGRSKSAKGWKFNYIEKDVA